ncbi:unnamed protein product [Discula destructiva]
MSDSFSSPTSALGQIAGPDKDTQPQPQSSVPTTSTTSEAPVATRAAIPIPFVPVAFEARKAWIIKERQQSVQRYAQRSMKTGGIPAEDAATTEWLERTDRLLNFLEHELEITPRLKEGAHIDLLLKFIFEDPRFHFPEPYKQRARALYEEFLAKNWGTIPDPHEDPEVEIEGEAPGDQNQQAHIASTTTSALAAAANAESTSRVAYIRQPPADHAIWGVNGIMHGIVPKLGGKIRTLQLDRRFLREKRPANVSGYNGLRVGDWFPYQMSALFHGAHGARMAGISGNTSYGAYSIVVAGMYKDVDDE